MDKLDEAIIKNYRQIRQELIPMEKECPREDLLLHYVKGEIGDMEREKMEEHLFACPECLESLKVIRMIQQAQESPHEMPAHLFKKARAILHNELAGSASEYAQKLVILKLSLIWDQVLNKIIQLKSDAAGMIIASRPEFQPVRKVSKDSKENALNFPLKRAIEINEGTIHLEIDVSDKKGYLTLKTSLHIRAGQIQLKVSSVRAILYKSGRMCSSVHLNKRGEAIFSRIKEGPYSFELRIGEKSLGVIEVSVSKVKK
ncbi:MAG: anti-sigma factor family protein [bacterium]